MKPPNSNDSDLDPMCRVMLFAYMLGLKKVWGVEIDGRKVWKADIAVRRALAITICPPYILNNGFYLDQIAVEDVKALPPGASVIFSFWLGLNDIGKAAIGRLASQSDSFKLLCLVQHSQKHLEDDLTSKYGFPKIKKVKTLTNVAACGGSTFTAYIFKKADM